jgi:hypothetical protein
MPLNIGHIFQTPKPPTFIDCPRAAIGQKYNNFYAQSININAVKFKKTF